MLRALKVPAGKHQIVLTFKPKSINTTETIAYIAGVVLLLALLMVCYVEWKKRKK